MNIEEREKEYEFLLQDRLQKIRQIIGEYGEDKFFISFSGGKDSTVLSAMIDMALPKNKIPRVYANTGIEYKHMVDHVKALQNEDDRIFIIKPQVNIKKTLEEYGYPFKSKEHSEKVGRYQRRGYVLKQEQLAYLGMAPLTTTGEYKIRQCPDVLRYQFSPSFKIRLSDKCCLKMKEEPIEKYAKDNGRPYHIVGIMASEGGRRTNAKCLSLKNGKLKSFQPLVPLDKDFEDWFIQRYDVKLCDLYLPPYNLKRTGCKGCPLALNIANELEVIEKYFPSERKQCERIWKTVYDEYRRLGYRGMKYKDADQIEGQTRFESIDMEIKAYDEL